MGLLSWLKTSEKAVDTGLDLVKEAASGIDMLWFTDEEKSQASLQVMESLVKFHEAQKDENSIRAQTRRSLAKAIMYSWLAVVMAGVGCGFYGDTVRAKYMFDVATNTMGNPVLAVTIFYFGYYGVMTAAKWMKK